MEPVRYEYALTDNEILTYSQIIDKFKKGEITFQNVTEMFASYDITIEPVLRDFSKQKMTVSDANMMKDRLANKQYLYSDINYFLLNSEKFKNIAFRIDYKAVELLANLGIPEYQTSMVNILMTEMRLSHPTDPKSLAEQNKKQRRIEELKLELSKTEDMNSPKL